MAVTYGGTVISGLAEVDREQAGGTATTPTTFTDIQYYRDITVTTAKATVENASESVTYDALIAAITVSLTATAANDFNAVPTVDVYGEVSKIEADVVPKYGNVANNYVCTCKLYAKVS